ncbi:hypothetical protein [Deinococcus frigens]|uniref:hypothetical protein n=1 Tax=Deinococcus frigens TaxID=249403 RepID=UPI0012EC924C|nr:hypothetical protein [Deinococcus frigens]
MAWFGTFPLVPDLNAVRITPEVPTSPGLESGKNDLRNLEARERSGLPRHIHPSGKGPVYISLFKAPIPDKTQCESTFINAVCETAT